LFWNYFRYKVKDCARRDQEKDLTRVNVGENALKNSRIAIELGKLTKLNGSLLRAFLVFEGGFSDVIGWRKWDFLDEKKRKCHCTTSLTWVGKGTDFSMSRRILNQQPQKS
jgi:hypothetical protein